MTQSGEEETMASQRSCAMVDINILLYKINFVTQNLMCEAWEEPYLFGFGSDKREHAGYVEKGFREALSLGGALNRRLNNRLDTSTAGIGLCPIIDKSAHVYITLVMEKN